MFEQLDAVGQEAVKLIDGGLLDVAAPPDPMGGHSP